MSAREPTQGLRLRLVCTSVGICCHFLRRRWLLRGLLRDLLRGLLRGWLRHLLRGWLRILLRGVLRSVLRSF